MKICKCFDMRDRALRSRLLDRAAAILFCLAAAAMVFALAAVCTYILRAGLPAIARIGLRDFLLGTHWKPSGGIYGIAPMLVGSAVISLFALGIGVVCGLCTAVWLVWYCPRALYDICRSALELLAGIPSVVYGFFGMSALSPLICRIFGNGFGIPTASLLLGIMLVPTIASLAEASFRSLPASVFDGARALGASRERAVFFAVIPSARRSIGSALMLAAGRAVGETTAVMMVAGNQPRMPHSLTDGIRTLTVAVALEMGYATDAHRAVLCSVSAILLCISLTLGLIFSTLSDGGDTLAQ